MASELRVNTLKDASGNNSIGMSFVANGSAKAWADYDGGTPDIRDSLNTSSFGDNGTGDHTQNLTNSMASANYSYCLLYTSPSPRDGLLSRMPSSA